LCDIVRESLPDSQVDASTCKEIYKRPCKNFTSMG
jgi:hypothetical protein